MTSCVRETGSVRRISPLTSDMLNPLLNVGGSECCYATIVVCCCLLLLLFHWSEVGAYQETQNVISSE